MRTLVVACISALAASALTGDVIGYSINTNANDHLWEINLNTGVATDLGKVAFSDGEGLTFDDSGNLYTIGGGTDEFWDITVLPGSMIGMTGDRDGSGAGLEFHNGTIYNLNGAEGISSLYTIDVGTGAATLVGSSTIFGDNLAIDSAATPTRQTGCFAMRCTRLIWPTAASP
ncbi:MAG: hypothetical protein ACR2HJ_11785 [Fimbriimonadales bacterium]